MMKMIWGLSGFVVLALVLGGCAQQSDPSEVVERYITARVEGDAGTLQSLSCAAWEAQAAIQAESFRAVDAELEGMDCQRTGEENGFAVVSCEGRIVTTYDGEEREWELGSYLVEQADGEWRLCGEA